MYLPTRKSRRHGAIAPLTAFLGVVLVGMGAFALDIGWITLTQAQLQSAADAGAMAGADPLMNGYIQFTLATSPLQKQVVLQTTLPAALSQAKTFAGYNWAGDVNNLTLLDSDIEFGFTNASGQYTAQGNGGDLKTLYTTILAQNSPGYPNTIKVTMRRDSSANGTLNLYFAPVIGTNYVSLTAQAASTVYGGTLDSLPSNLNYNIAMLPMAYDVNSWKNFINTGLDPDGNKNTDVNGNPTLQVYPSLKAPGNFGQLSLNGSHAGESTESGWVDNGVGPSDIAALQSAGLIPLSKHPANTWDWVGNTGFKASLVMDVNSYSGKTFMLPLFNPYNADPNNYSAGTGQGSHYYYNVVQFVGVQIVPGGGNRGVTVQPAPIIDSNFPLTNVAPAGTTGSGTVTTFFTTPKLSQ